MNFPRRSQSAPTPTAAIDAMLARFPDHAVAKNLRAAVTALGNDYRYVIENNARISGDRTLTDAGRLLRSAKLAKTRMARRRR